MLEPLLFLIFDLIFFINGIHDNKDSQMRLFADDRLVHSIINCLNNYVKLQEDLSLLCDWESRWQMADGFNKSKCYVLHMSRKKQSIGTLSYLQDIPPEISTEQKYLGVDMSNDLDRVTISTLLPPERIRLLAYCAVT